MGVLEAFATLLNCVALVVVLGFVYGVLKRLVLPGAWRDVLVTLCFTLGGWIAMLTPVMFENGVRVDLRVLFFVLPAAFAGARVGGAALALILIGHVSFFEAPAVGPAFWVWMSLNHLVLFLAAHVFFKRVRRALMFRRYVRALILAGGVIGVSVITTNWAAILDIGNMLWLKHLTAIGINGLGAFLGALAMLREDELLRRDNRNQRLARVDPLTALLNRRGFFDTVAKEGLGARYAVLCFDLDQFKAFNDAAGHGDGDRLLMALADVLRRTMPHNTIIARFGGDEFVVLLRQPHVGGAILLGQEVIDILEQISPPGGKPFAQTVSVGHAEGHAENDLNKVLHRADAAMYRAKAEGGSRLYGEKDRPSQIKAVKG